MQPRRLLFSRLVTFLLVEAISKPNVSNGNSLRLASVGPSLHVHHIRDL